MNVRAVAVDARFDTLRYDAKSGEEEMKTGGEASPGRCTMLLDTDNFFSFLLFFVFYFVVPVHFMTHVLTADPPFFSSNDIMSTNHYYLTTTSRVVFRFTRSEQGPEVKRTLLHISFLYLGLSVSFFPLSLSVCRYSGTAVEQNPETPGLGCWWLWPRVCTFCST